mmetsp:Transcript_34509/g.108693  ORF Transcript_34509/g.108693 Transcript_34509/m.108693 type:complete len:234 (-) Transcript_34509:444-1145(-)
MSSLVYTHASVAARPARRSPPPPRRAGAAPSRAHVSRNAVHPASRDVHQTLNKPQSMRNMPRAWGALYPHSLSRDKRLDLQSRYRLVLRGPFCAALLQPPYSRLGGESRGAPRNRGRGLRRHRRGDGGGRQLRHAGRAGPRCECLDRAAGGDRGRERLHDRTHDVLHHLDGRPGPALEGRPLVRLGGRFWLQRRLGLDQRRRLCSFRRRLWGRLLCGRGCSRRRGRLCRSRRL